jgi:hypothetical protein
MNILYKSNSCTNMTNLNRCMSLLILCLSALILTSCGGGAAALGENVPLSIAGTSNKGISGEGNSFSPAVFEPEQDAAINAAAFGSNTRKDVLADVKQPFNTPVLPETNCPFLKSGQYWLFSTATGQANRRVQKFNFDAATLAASYELGSSALSSQGQGTLTFSPVFNQPCRFMVNQSTSTFVLYGKTGMFFLYEPTVPGNTATYNVSLGVPITPSDLRLAAGLYNHVSYIRSGPEPTATLSFSHGTATLTATGEFTQTSCGINTACSQPAYLTRFAKASDGGFYDAEQSTRSRTGSLMYHYRGISSDTLIILEPGFTGFTIATRQQANVLPAVGGANPFWDAGLSNSGTSTGFSVAGGFVTTSVDVNNQSYQRLRVWDGRVDGFSINTPYAGMQYRPSGVSTLTSGATLTLGALVSMRIPNESVSFYGFTSTFSAPQLGFSVQRLSRLHDAQFREIYRYYDLSGQTSSLGTATVANDALNFDGNSYNISDWNTNTSTSSRNIYFSPIGNTPQVTAAMVGNTSRIATLCTNVPGQSGTKGTYMLISSTALAITDTLELGTRTYSGFKDCEASPGQTITFVGNGSVQLLSQSGTSTVSETISATDVSELVSPDGLTKTINGELYKVKWNIYKMQGYNFTTNTLGSIFYSVVEVGRNLSDSTKGYLLWWTN